jgi:hypothetical protein
MPRWSLFDSPRLLLIVVILAVIGVLAVVGAALWPILAIVEKVLKSIHP